MVSSPRIDITSSPDHASEPEPEPSIRGVLEHGHRNADAPAEHAAIHPRAARPLPRILSIHNPVLPGAPLLLWPDGVLVRWHPRSPIPELGSPYTGTRVVVPTSLREIVYVLLFGSNALSRCDAAARIAREPGQRARILCRIYSKSYVKQLLAGAQRLDSATRSQIEATGGVPIRQLTHATRASAAVPRIRREP